MIDSEIQFAGTALEAQPAENSSNHEVLSDVFTGKGAVPSSSVLAY
jgi:hypothetical protein